MNYDHSKQNASNEDTPPSAEKDSRLADCLLQAYDGTFEADTSLRPSQSFVKKLDKQRINQTSVSAPHLHPKQTPTQPKAPPPFRWLRVAAIAVFWVAVAGIAATKIQSEYSLAWFEKPRNEAEHNQTLAEHPNTIKPIESQKGDKKDKKEKGEKKPKKEDEEKEKKKDKNKARANKGDDHETDELKTDEAIQANPILKENPRNILDIKIEMVSYDDIPLTDAIRDLHEMCEVNFSASQEALFDSSITLYGKNISLRAVLDIMVGNNKGLTYKVTDNTIWITRTKISKPQAPALKITAISKAKEAERKHVERASQHQKDEATKHEKSKTETLKAQIALAEIQFSIAKLELERLNTKAMPSQLKAAKATFHASEVEVHTLTVARDRVARGKKTGAFTGKRLGEEEIRLAHAKARLAEAAAKLKALTSGPSKSQLYMAKLKMNEAAMRLIILQKKVSTGNSNVKRIIQR